MVDSLNQKKVVGRHMLPHCVHSISECLGGPYSSTELRAVCKKFRNAIQPPARSTVESYYAYCLSNDMLYAVESLPNRHMTDEVIQQAICTCSCKTVEFICRRACYISSAASNAILKRGDADVTTTYIREGTFSAIFFVYKSTSDAVPAFSLEHCITNIDEMIFHYHCIDLTTFVMGSVFAGLQVSKLRILATYGILERQLCREIGYTLPGPDWVKIAKTNKINLVEFAWKYHYNAPFLDKEADRQALQCPDVTSADVREFLRKRINC